MTDRYQDRPFPADDDYNRRDNRHAQAKAESDPLAELARLIGQTDPVASMGRANHQLQPRGGEREQPQQDYACQDDPAENHTSTVHPLHRYASARPAPEPSYHEAPPFAETDHEPDQEPDPSRYDEALYGPLETGEQEPQYDQAYSDDPYGYQDGDDGEPE